MQPSPCLLIPVWRSLLPLEGALGVQPRHTAPCRERAGGASSQNRNCGVSIKSKQHPAAGGEENSDVKCKANSLDRKRDAAPLLPLLI
jgi:hypothetical protein